MAKFTPSTDVGPVRLPRQNYKLRIMQEPEFKNSKKGNKMLVFQFEIIDPASLVIDGAERNVAGIKLTSYVVTEEGKTRTLTELFNALGINLSEVEFSDETGLPEGISFTGMELWAECMSTREDRKDESGNPLMNPNTNKPQQITRYEIKNFLGMS